MVHFGGMIVDCGCSLGAEVPALRIEIERRDAVVTMPTGELDAVFDALGLVGFHWLNCSPALGGSGDRWLGGEGNWETAAKPSIPRSRENVQVRTEDC